MHDAKADLQQYLTKARDALLWKLDGLSEYDVRRPLVPSGTNLLGIVKHVGSVAVGYFGETFGRPFPEDVPWFATDAPPASDLWATADETREAIVGFYRRVWIFADETIAATPIDGIGRVPWWPEGDDEVTLHTILVHMVAEVNRHAGHADLVRELIDGAVGLRVDNDNLDVGDDGWQAHHDRVEAAARRASES